MENPSVLLYGALTAKVEDRPIPTISDPHDVIVQIAYTGVCGSDVSHSVETNSGLSPHSDNSY
jgi:D-xylulose reductase